MKRFLLFLLLIPIVYAVSFEEAKDAYFDAVHDVQHLKSLNYSTLSFDDMLFQMDEALYGKNVSLLIERARILNDSGEADKIVLAAEIYRLIDDSIRSGLRPGVNYSFVIYGASWINERKSMAFEAHDVLSEFESRLSSSNDSIFFIPVLDTLDQAKRAFADERYEVVFSLVSQGGAGFEQALVESARERAYLRLARRNVVNYVQDHWRGLLLTLLILSVLSLWAFFEVRYYRVLNRFKRLEAELSSVAQSMRSSQEEYYTSRLGASSYRARMNSFKKKSRDLKIELSVVRSLLHSYRKFSLFGKFKR